MKFIKIFFFFILLNPILVFSQNERNIWYFGHNAGLDFNSGAPVALSNSAMNVTEGCASICDNNGNLLFYTNGDTVYNSNHQAMPNGMGLGGDVSSSQSATILKKPGTSNIYTLFTMDAAENGFIDGFSYVEIDMTLQSGLGDVSLTPILPIYAPTNSEKITTIRHQNGIDYWIVIVDTSEVAFRSYLFNSNGISTTPIISPVSYTITMLAGYLKANSNGNQIATFINTNNAAIFDFDNSNGNISDGFLINSAYSYGLEFSESGQFLYMSNYTIPTMEVLQFDLYAGSHSDIINSKEVIAIDSVLTIGAFQLAPDGKIYIAHYLSYYLSVISNPNIQGINCNYTLNGIPLANGTTSAIGLPNHTINSLKTYYHYNICKGDSIQLYDSTFSNYNWSLTTSPPNVISLDSSFTVSPIYSTNYMLFDGLDTTIFIVTVNPTHYIDLGPNLSLCDSDTISLIDQNYSTTNNFMYNWNNGSNTDSILVLSAGTYWLTTNLGNCTNTDTIEISNGPTIEINTFNPNCFGESNGSITVNSIDTSNISFLILDSANNSLNILGTNVANNISSGTYTIESSIGANCTSVNEVSLFDPSEIESNISITHNLCYNDELGKAIIDSVENYQGAFDSIQYIWNPNPYGSNGLLENVNNKLIAGEYVVDIIDDFGCYKQIVFNITEPEPLIGDLNVASPTYCRMSSFQNGRGEVTVTNVTDSSGTGNISYEWINNVTGESSNATTFIVSCPGWMTATLIDDNNCVFIDSIYVDSLNPVAQFSSISEQFEYPDFYEGTELMEIEFINESYNFSKPTYPLSDTTFKWNLFTNQEFTGNSNWFFSFDYSEPIDTVYEGEQIYEVCLVAKNWNGCTDTTCKEILVHEQPLLIAPNVFTPGLSPNENFFFPNEGIEQFKCLVFDRWGILVFEFNTIEDFWDGNHYLNDKPCVDGVYFYQYEAKSTNHQTFKGEGFVHLIRD